MYEGPDHELAPARAVQHRPHTRWAEGGCEPLPGEGRCHRSLLGAPGVDDAGCGDEDEPFEAPGRCGCRLGGDEAAQRVTDQHRAALDPELLAEVVEHAAIGGYVDIPGGHRAAAEARQVERYRSIAAREVRQVLEPG